MTLGPYPELSFDEAKSKARKSLNLLREGVDPIVQGKLELKQREKELAKQDALSVTLEQLMESFFRL